MGKVLRRVLGISPQETSFARRGFRCDSDSVRQRLEEVGRCFVHGYLRALEADGAETLAARIDAEVAAGFRGFAYEGAAMGLALLDMLTPWRRDRLRCFLDGPADLHVYIVHIGAGWALARLPIPVDKLLADLDPVLGWLALDGYGFHQGFFHWPQAISRQQVPRRVKGYARRPFDHGLGRSLWFVEGADPGRIVADIAAFPDARQADLWSGVGLACAYAGGVDVGTVEALRLAAGPAGPALAQGVSFAAAARLRAGDPTPDTALACAVVCGMTVEEAAAGVADALQAAREPPAHRDTVPSVLAGDRAAPARRTGTAEVSEAPLFELWRQHVQRRFSSEVPTS